MEYIPDTTKTLTVVVCGYALYWGSARTPIITIGGATNTLIASTEVFGRNRYSQFVLSQYIVDSIKNSPITFTVSSEGYSDRNDERAIGVFIY